MVKISKRYLIFKDFQQPERNGKNIDPFNLVSSDARLVGYRTTTQRLACLRN